MSADSTRRLVFEALAHAEDAVPQSIGRRHDQYVIVDEARDIDDSGYGLTTLANEQHVSARKPRVVYVRHDAMLAALSLLAARAAEVEAERYVLLARVEKFRSELQNIVDESDISEHSTTRVESMAALAEQALSEDDDDIDLDAARKTVARLGIDVDGWAKDIRAKATDALIAERDAATARVGKLRTRIADALSAHELTANGPAQTVIEDVQGALDEDEKSSEQALTARKK